MIQILTTKKIQMQLIEGEQQEDQSVDDLHQQSRDIGSEDHESTNPDDTARNN